METKTQIIEERTIKNDTLLITGFFALIISFSLFAIGNFVEVNNERMFEKNNFFGLFIINYGIALVYLIVWIATKNFKFKKLFSDNLSYTLIFVLLCFISCFSLNRALPIFKSSTLWLQIVLILSSFSIAIKILYRLNLQARETISIVRASIQNSADSPGRKEGPDPESSSKFDFFAEPLNPVHLKAQTKVPRC